MNLTEHLMNPRRQMLRKWLISVLGDRYAKHDPIVERIGAALVTQKDAEDFGKLVAEIYEVAYMKCLNDYKVKLADLNINVTLTSPS